MTDWLTQWCLDEHTLVELLHVRRDAQGRHGVEDSERMASVEKLSSISLVKSSEGKEDNVVDHVGVAGERANIGKDQT